MLQTCPPSFFSNKILETREVITLQAYNEINENTSTTHTCSLMAGFDMLVFILMISFLYINLC